jgi:molecular chaperone HscB
VNDHFSLFDLPARYALDLDALERAYRRVQAQVHPDRHAAASPAERRVAMQWAARANEAYTALRSPLARAAYLCEQRGAPIEAESNTAMPAAFMQQQLQWREALDDARAAGQGAAVQALADELAATRRDLQAHVGSALDQNDDAAAAARLVRQWMFVERFGEDVLRVRHALEDAAAGAAAGVAGAAVATIGATAAAMASGANSTGT